MPSLSGPARARLALAMLLPASLVVASCSSQAPPSPDASLNGPAPAASGEGPATSLFQAPRKADGDVFIQIVTNGISPFWSPMGVGMKKAAEELGCKAEWSGPQNSEVAQQKQMVENALAKGADGVAISSIEADPTVPIVDAVLEKQVPVITFDSDSPRSRRLVYIGTNNYNAGVEAGKAAVRLLPSGGKFVGFVGNVSAQNARERRQGFEDATKDHNIQLIEVFDDGKDASRARRNVEDAMAKHGDDIAGFLGLFSYNGPAIVGAVVDAGKRDRYKIVCFDAEPVTLQELEKGNVDATVVQKPYMFGYLSTKLLYLINRKGFAEAAREMNIPADGIVDTGVQVITPATIKEYRKELEKLGVESS